MLKRTVLVGFAAQLYVALIGVVMMPIYLRHLGPEAFGLVGFFVMLQVWFQLLDMGLGPTLARELSRYRAGMLDAANAWALTRALEWLFGLLAVCFAVLAYLAGDWIAADWLNPERLTVDEVAISVALMGGAAGARWLVGLYRGGLVGLEEQVRAQAINVVMATLKSMGVLLVLIYVEASARSFFIYQGVMAIIEVLLFRGIFYRYMPEHRPSIWPCWAALRGVGRFAGGMGFVAGMWVLITQLDKLVLARTLSLQDYGYFTLAVTAASGVSILFAPLHQAVQPRLTILATQQHEAGLTSLYRIVTQLTVGMMCAIAGVMALFAEPLLLAWTGDADAAHRAAPILFWYALGNGVVGILSVPFLLQYARGQLRLHIVGNAIFGVFWVPAVIYMASRYGGVGAGIAWLTGNLVFLLVWPVQIHARLMPALKWAWLRRDVGAVAGASAAVLYWLSFIDISGFGRVQVVLILAGLVLLLGVIGIIAGDRSRQTVFAWIGKSL